MTRFRPLLLTLFCVALPASLEAQGRARPTSPQIPEHMQPPVGKCRIWMDGVSPAQQPAPTDCQTALRQKPSNGTVVFGPTEKVSSARSFGVRPRATRQDSAAESESSEARRPTTPPARPGDRTNDRTPTRSAEGSQEKAPEKAPERTPPRTPDRTQPRSPDRSPPPASPSRRTPTPEPTRPSARPSTPEPSNPAPRRPDTLAADVGRP
jgi:hypothetical protein